MHTRSRWQYSINSATQQQQDVMDEILNQLHFLNNRMDMVWNHVFDKPESSGEKNKDENELEEGSGLFFFFSKVVCLHGLPTSIVSDHDV
jgi:hypothetical protein